MTVSPTTSRTNLNHLRLGETYAATTRTGRVTTGQYLGIEVPSDDWRILIRTNGGTRSISIDTLESVHAEAA